MNTDDGSPQKEAQELKDLTKVLRAVDLNTKQPNETSMIDANGNCVEYLDNSYVLHMHDTPWEKVKFSQKELDEMALQDRREMLEHGEPEGVEVISNKDIEDEK